MDCLLKDDIILKNWCMPRDSRLVIITWLQIGIPLHNTPCYRDPCLRKQARRNICTVTKTCAVCRNNLWTLEPDGQIVQADQTHRFIESHMLQAELEKSTQSLSMKKKI